MAIFAVLAQPNMDEAVLTDKVGEFYPDSFKLAGNVGWLVVAHTSAENLAIQLGISQTGPAGPAIVFEIKSYWGRANPNTWTWLKEKFEAASNG